MHGVLDPSPLLRGNEKASLRPTEACNRINPLLLVTERKGVTYSLHYGAFPLDAFHTDGEWGVLYGWINQAHESGGSIFDCSAQH